MRYEEGVKIDCCVEVPVEVYDCTLGIFYDVRVPLFVDYDWRATSDGPEPEVLTSYEVDVHQTNEELGAMVDEWLAEGGLLVAVSCREVFGELVGVLEDACND